MHKPNGSVNLNRIRNDQTKLNQLRRYTHHVFDATWETKYQRGQAYAWLARQLGIDGKECHIAQFTFAQCYETIRLVKDKKPRFTDRNPSEKRFERKINAKSTAV